MKRDELLLKAAELVNGARADVYGDAYENHQRIAKMWEVILGTPITVEDVYMCMIAVKLARLANMQNHEDSWVDIAGYAALGGEALFNIDDVKGVMK